MYEKRWLSCCFFFSHNKIAIMPFTLFLLPHKRTCDSLQGHTEIFKHCWSHTCKSTITTVYDIVITYREHNLVEILKFQLNFWNAEQKNKKKSKKHDIYTQRENIFKKWLSRKCSCMVEPFNAILLVAFNIAIVLNEFSLFYSLAYSLSLSPPLTYSFTTHFVLFSFIYTVTAWNTFSA